MCADLLTKNASTTQKGVVELATNTETTAGLALQANDPRIMFPINTTSYKVEGEFYYIDGIDSTGNEFLNHSPSGPFLIPSATGNDNSPSFYGNGTPGVDATHGGYQQFDTSATLSSSYVVAGLGGIVQRKYNPQYYIKFSIPTTSTMRLFMGFASGFAN